MRRRWPRAPPPPVLASAYLSHQNDGQASPFAIDLSSERVRTARWLIDGVRQGQPLAALLGYRLERALHDRGGLDTHIATFRKLAPLASSPSTPTVATDAIAASNVVHGLDILGQWKTKDPRFQALRSSGKHRGLHQDRRRVRGATTNAMRVMC